MGAGALASIFAALAHFAVKHGLQRVLARQQRAVKVGDVEGQSGEDDLRGRDIAQTTEPVEGGRAQDGGGENPMPDIGYMDIGLS